MVSVVSICEQNKRLHWLSQIPQIYTDEIRDHLRSVHNHFSRLHRLIAGKSHIQAVYGIVQLVVKIKIFKNGLQEILLLPLAKLIVIRLIAQVLSSDLFL